MCTSSGLKLALVNELTFCATYEVDTGSTTENVGTWHDGFTSGQPLGRSRMVERSCLGVELHVLGVYARPMSVSRASVRTLPVGSHGNPWVVQIVLSSLNQQNLEVPVQGRQSTSDDTPSGTSCGNRQPAFMRTVGYIVLTPSNDNINLIWDRHDWWLYSMMPVDYLY